MDFIELINRRTSVRSYSKETLEPDVLETVLREAQRAPSWKNSQTARSYVVTSPEKLEELREKGLPAFNQKSSAGAALIVSTYVKGIAGFSNGGPDNELGDKWGVYDLGLHDAYLVLAAADAGLDTLILGIRDADVIRGLLGIPEEEEIVSVIAIGKKDGELAFRPRKDLGEAAHFI